MKRTHVCGFCLVMLASCLAATQAPAQFRPAQVRVADFGPWSQTDCLARAKQALDLEGYAVDSTGTDYYGAHKGPAHAYLTCDPYPDGRVLWSVVVASTASDESCLAERDRLSSRLKNPTTDAASGAGTAGASSSGGASGGSGTSGGSGATGGTASGSLPWSTSLVNLALNHPATQSSHYFPPQPDRPEEAMGAVDGKKTGGFGFHTKSEPNPWWQVDLGAVSDLTWVRIFNRLDEAARARTIQVLLSSNGSDWTRVYAHDGSVFGGVDGKPLVVPLNGHAARFVRLQLAETNLLHLDEVEVYGKVMYSEDSAAGRGAGAASPSAAGGGGTNLALGRTARQSSYYYQPPRPDEAQGGADGQKNGGYGFHTQSEPNPWWQVDLGSVRPLTEIRVFNRLDCCSDRAQTLQVLFSDDGVNWTRVFSNNGLIFGGIDGKALLVPVKGRSARFVRLQLGETNYLHLDEVEIY